MYQKIVRALGKLYEQKKLHVTLVKSGKKEVLSAGEIEIFVNNKKTRMYFISVNDKETIVSEEDIAAILYKELKNCDDIIFEDMLIKQ